MSTRITLKKPYDFVIEKMEDWAIYKTYANKKEFVSKVKVKLLEDANWILKDDTSLRLELKNILYQEKMKFTHSPWKSDKEKEKLFWNGIKKKLVTTSSIDYNGKTKDIDEKILHEIIEFYGHEMIANFKPRTFRLAQKAIPYVYSRLINQFPRMLYRMFGSIDSLYDRMKITGDIEHIRKLAKEGTIIAVPTHYSNLDSPTVGLSLNNLGIPAFTYGAGINLFTMGLISRYMHNLGAYTVDRRRKHKLYNDTLKCYSTIAMTEGVNSLFFPGGGRSHSGEVESKLKLGLLGTTIEAQRMNLIKDGKDAKKIYILPITLNYHYVLEASKLIEYKLKEDGKELYFPDENTGYFGLIKRAYKVITSNPGMTICFAPLMDVFGNKVNQDGESIGKKGEVIKVEDYFKLNGKITKNIQRDKQYTQILGEEIIKEYKINSVVLSSNLVAFVAFQILRKRFNQFSVFELLSLPLDETNISTVEFKIVLDRIRDRLKILEKNEEVILSEDLNLPIEELMNIGIKKVGSSHPKKVLKKNRKGIISTQSMKLLYYYNNKLTCYELEKYI